MFKKILVCVDPYPPGNNLIFCAVSLKKLGAEEVVLAHVIVDAPLGLDEMLIAQARPEMERQKQMLEKAGFKAAIAMEAGSPASSSICFCRSSSGRAWVISISSSPRGASTIT